MSEHDDEGDESLGEEEDANVSGVESEFGSDNSGSENSGSEVDSEVDSDDDEWSEDGVTSERLAEIIHDLPRSLEDETESYDQMGNQNATNQKQFSREDKIIFSVIRDYSKNPLKMWS
jgi:hypothetical protein